MNKEENQQSKRLPGFYIALCCCVIAVGIAGYFTERSSTDTAGGDDTSLSQPEMVAENNAEDSIFASADANITEADTPQIFIEAEGETAETAEEAEAKTADAPQVIYEDLTEANAEPVAAIIAEPSFMKPSDGEVLEGFSDTLIYNSALGDWRTHNGVDIEVSKGGSVSAAADGTISKISSDAMGEYIVIDHDGGFSTKYCSLASTEAIAEGDAVKAGDVIGIASDSKAENVKECHLHFELYKDGTAVNPVDYMQ